MSPPVPQEYQNAPTASTEKTADPMVRNARRMSLRTRLMVRGDVTAW
jgi:hypothetical protein